MREGKRKAERLLAGMLAMALVLSGAGCGKEDRQPAGDGQAAGTQQTGGQMEVEQPEENPGPVWTYQPETLTLDAEKWLTSDRMKVQYFSVRPFGDYLYFEIEQEFDEETQTYGYRFYRYSVQEGTSERLTKILHDSGPLSIYDIGEDGSIYAVNFREISMGGPSQQKMDLMKYNAGGDTIYSLDLAETLGISSWDEIGDSIAVFGDSAGGVCLVCGKRLFFFDGEGNLTGSLDPCDGRQNADIRSAGRGEGSSIYVKLTVRTGETEEKYLLLEVDPDSRTFHTISEDFLHVGPLSAGLRGDLLQNNIWDSVLYDYDLDTQTGEPLLNWTDYGFTGGSIQNLGLTSDGKILAIMINREAFEWTVLLLSKTLTEKKQEIVLGTVTAEPALQDAAAKFNRSSDRYHVTVKDYSDGKAWSVETAAEAWSKMTMELAVGKGPDLIQLDQYKIPVLAKQGILEDLGPYLEQSAVLHREDFVDHVLECAAYDGTQVALPKQFMLSTVIGRASDVGKDMGWTRDEFMALAAKYPGAQVLSYSGKSRLLNCCMGYDLGAFVDWESGKCNFNDPEFIRMLEFADRYGATAADDDDIPPAQYQKRQILLDDAYLSELQWPQYADMLFQGEACAVGYPTEDGSAAHFICANRICGIAANSRHKEGAWAFLESFVTAKPRKHAYDFPALKSLLEEMVQEEMADVAYKLDENWERVLDENGDPITERRVTKGIRYDNWEFEYYTLTAEEAERTMEIIRAARPLPVEDAEIRAIIDEETEVFFGGGRSAEQTANIIQNRVQLYLNER